MTQLSAQVLPEGTHVGLYEINHVLHVGSNAITYRAWNHHVNVPIVLREYFPQPISVRHTDGLSVTVANADEQTNYHNGLAGFLELAEALLPIEHPNISKIQSSLEANNTAYMVLDYLDCESLSQRLGKGATFTEADIFQLLIPLFAALQQIHSQGLFHGDIRPENILISNNQAILVGFSVLSVAELYSDALRPTPTSDLYQLAEVIYQGLTTIKPIALPARLAAVHEGEQDPLQPLQNIANLKANPKALQSIYNMLSLDEQQRPKTAIKAYEALMSNASEGDAKQAGLILTSDYAATSDANKVAINPALWLSLLGGVALLFIISFFILPLEKSQKTNTAVDNRANSTVAQTEQQKLTKSRALVSEVKPEAENQAIVQTQELQIVEQEEVKITKLVATNNTTKLNSTVKIQPEPIGEEIIGVSSKIAQIVQLISQATETSNWAKGKGLPFPERIQWHLTQAQGNIAAIRLTTPLQHNAYQHYRIVLALDPNNNEAQAGMNKMIGIYKSLITRAINEGRLKHAYIYLNRAEAVNKQAPAIKQLRTQLLKGTFNP